ncbi:hypothetical protein D9M70_470910 [compost metagenome]
MFGNRRHVREAGDVAAGLFHVLDELGAERVGNGGEDDRDVAGRGNDRLGGRRRDRHDHVRCLAGELAGDLRSGCRVALGRLVDELEVLAFLVAGGGQRILHAVAGGIERRMLDDRGYGDGHLIGTGGQGECHRGGKGDEK